MTKFYQKAKQNSDGSWTGFYGFLADSMISKTWYSCRIKRLEKIHALEDAKKELRNLKEENGQ